MKVTGGATAEWKKLIADSMTAKRLHGAGSPQHEAAKKLLDSYQEACPHTHGRFVAEITQPSLTGKYLPGMLIVACKGCRKPLAHGYPEK